MQQKEGSSPHPFSFQKQERICSKITLDQLLHKRQTLFYYPFKCYYDLTPCGDSVRCNRMAVSVPKKRLKHAVDRNLVKRRTREAYRLNKHILLPIPEKTGKCVSIFFVFVGSEIPSFNFINDKIILILNRLLSDNFEI